jgi:hypothetical protein
MATISDPINNPKLWDFVVVSGIVSPGQASLQKASRSNVFDKKQGPGTAGGTTTYRGDKLAEFELTLKLWLQSHWDALPRFLSALKFDPKKKSGQAVDISHPMLSMFDPPIRSVVAEEIGQPDRIKDGDTLYVIKIQLSEFRPPKKENVTKSANGSSSAKDDKKNAGLKVPDIIVQNNKQIAALTQQLKQSL